MEAFTVQGFRARIYVAAPPDYANAPSLIRHNSVHISSVYAHRPISRVSEPDRREMIRLVKSLTDYTLVYPVGSWVRIRQGRYVGDVGYIFNSTSTNQYFSQKCDNYRILSYSLSTISIFIDLGPGGSLMPPLWHLCRYAGAAAARVSGCLAPELI